MELKSKLKLKEAQKRVEEIAKKSGVDSILIMQSNNDTMEVVSSGGDKGKGIYKSGEQGKKSNHKEGEHKLYCEHVVNTNEELEVKNAAKSDEWKGNEDLVEFGFNNYMGLPIEVDGKVVGTVCALNTDDVDFKEGNEDSVYNKLKELKSDIENGKV